MYTKVVRMAAAIHACRRKGAPCQYIINGSMGIIQYAFISIWLLITYSLFKNTHFTKKKNLKYHSSDRILAFKIWISFKIWEYELIIALYLPDLCNWLVMSAVFFMWCKTQSWKFQCAQKVCFWPCYYLRRKLLWLL